MLLERLGMLYRGANRYTEAVDDIPADSCKWIRPPVRARRSRSSKPGAWPKTRTRRTEEADAALKKFPKDRMVKLAHASLLADMGKTMRRVAELRALLDGEKRPRNASGHRPDVRKGQAL